MPSPRSPSSRPRLAMVLTLLAAFGSGACSLIVRRSDDQCSADADCAQFGSGLTCQQGVCGAPSVASTSPTGSTTSTATSTSTLGPPGCFSGAPSDSAQFLNQCTGNQCAPFDNCARLGICSGAPLPALVPPSST